MSSLIQYVVVREGMPIGVSVVQAVHAATEVLRRCDVPVRYNTRVCALVAKDSDALVKLYGEVKGVVKTELIYEPDPPYNGVPTALATVPGEEAVLKPLFKNLALLGGRGSEEHPNQASQ